MDGAIRVSTGIYETPQQAIPHEDYRCLGCPGLCFLRNGDIRRPHFAHRKEENTCQHFERMGSNGETAQHKIAKLIIKNILDTKRDFSIVRMCHLCKQDELFYIPVKDILEVIVEAEVSNGRADVLIKFKEEEIVIEIMNTHRTKYRKGTWFELTIQEIAQKYKPEGPLVMNCNRFYRCNPCEEQVRKEQERRRQEHLEECRRQAEKEKQRELEREKERERCQKIVEEYKRHQREEAQRKKEESERIQKEIQERIENQNKEREEQRKRDEEEWERQRPERERREREEQEERDRIQKENEERYKRHLEEQERLQREYEEERIRERERKIQEKLEKERKQKEYQENYDKVHQEYYTKYVINKEPTPSDWEGKNSIMYKDCDFLHPRFVIEMQKRAAPLRVK